MLMTHGIIHAQAASPELITTWKARSYAPFGYAGKSLPSAGTPVDMSVALLQKNKLVDLSPYEIRWYAGGRLAGRGKGKTAFSLAAPRTGEESMEIRVNIPAYAGTALDAFVVIPIASPEAVIDSAKLPVLTGLFYFFNIKDPSSLAVEWRDSGGLLTLSASNTNNPLEFAKTVIMKQ